MFYKIIDENTIQKAPSYLTNKGKVIYTNDEKVYNKYGYYRLEILNEENDFSFQGKYCLKGNIIYINNEEPKEEVSDENIDSIPESENSKTEEPKEINSFWDEDGNPIAEYENFIRNERRYILAAWDIYSKNVAYGIYTETEEEHNMFINWYKALCNMEYWAFENVPEQVRDHMREVTLWAY